MHPGLSGEAKQLMMTGGMTVATLRHLGGTEVIS
jgi:hypothetical protein